MEKENFFPFFVGLVAGAILTMLVNVVANETANSTCQSLTGQECHRSSVPVQPEKKG